MITPQLVHNHFKARIKFFLFLCAGFAITLSYVSDFAALKNNALQHEHHQRRARAEKTKQTLNAVVHIGPHKTGTSSIQMYSASLVKDLANDNYEMPWSHTNPSAGSNAVNVATCFFGNNNNLITRRVYEPNIPVKDQYPCSKDLLKSGLEIAQLDHSILISAETFDQLNNDGVAALAEYLRPWNNVTIVMTYRRFYDWIISYHNQLSKRLSWEIFSHYLHDARDKLRPSIYDALIDPEWFNTTKDRYTLFVAPMFRKHFHNVVIMNYHDDRNSLPEQFYCDAMPHTPNTCKRMKHLARGKLKDINKSGTLVYEDIAYAAQKMGFIHIRNEEEYLIVLDAIQNHQERFLNLTSKDFSPKCPPKYLLDKLWEISLLAEEELPLGPAASITYSPASPIPIFGKDESKFGLRADFEKYLKTDRLCEVDMATTLASPVWKIFFEDLQYKLNA